jgi:hypothetical protein
VIDVQKHGAKDFAVYEDGALLAVVRYRKGGVAIKERLEGLQSRIRELEAGSTQMSLTEAS